MPNRLAHETSPYLLQHQHNPVDWYPWGPEALALAKELDRPILLSVGYSACHWCHVMERESFEDADTAAVMNEGFVNIKVDREERPDLDEIYMRAVQAFSGGHGGWPMTLFLTPDGAPFLAGTYFPPTARQGMPSFRQIMAHALTVYREQKGRLDEVTREVKRYLEASGRLPAAAGEVGGDWLARIAEAARQEFDAERGGFGAAPKFPPHGTLAVLLAHHHRSGEARSLEMATRTLDAMAKGGMYDQLSGGFARYSVDKDWRIPHFEKMLYDQAQIAVNCLEARQATGDERFAWLARGIFEYVARDLTGPEGGFLTAEDADSAVADPVAGEPDHAEGAFYVWRADELRAALGDDYVLLAAHFGLEEGGNVPARLDPQGEFRGRNILVQRRPLADTARQFALDPEAASDRLLALVGRVRELRARRPRPHRDDKVLAANNGLMISALARAHQVLGSEDGTRYLDAAVRAAEFLARELHDAQRGVLFRTWRAGRAGTEGFAEDYAFVIQGLLDLYEASFDLRWLQWAVWLQRTLDAQFWDEAHGGYFNSSAGDRHLVLRLKEDYDGAEPAASSVAAMNLFRLAAIAQDEALRQRGRRTVEAFRDRWSKAPHALPQMLCALELALEPPRHVVLAGDPARPDFRALAAVLHERLGPRRILLGATGGEAREWLARRAPWLAGMEPRDGRATAYVCEEFACQAPVTEPAELRARLR